MKKILTVAFVLALTFTSCEKVSINDYPSAIVGWWELVDSYPEDGYLEEGFRMVMEFNASGKYAPFQNGGRDENGNPVYKQYLFQVQPYYDYWIENDILCDMDKEDDCCSEFGYPNCECNIEGYLHSTKILELGKKNLTIEMCWDKTKTTWKFVKITKPSNLRYR